MPMEVKVIQKEFSLITEIQCMHQDEDLTKDELCTQLIAKRCSYMETLACGSYMNVCTINT